MPHCEAFSPQIMKKRIVICIEIYLQKSMYYSKYKNNRTFVLEKSVDVEYNNHI